MFNDLPIIANLALFAVIASGVWLAGTRLSYCIDAIAEQTHLARAFLGLILLATATELPEVVTTLTASAGGKGALALNNMFGGMLLQLLVLAIADIFVKDGTLSSRPHNPTVIVAGLLCVTSMSAVLIIYLLGDKTLIYHFGIGSLVVAVLYISAMYILEQIQDRHIWSAVDLPDEETHQNDRDNRFDKKSRKYLISSSLIAGTIILVFGVILVRLADTLAIQTGLGQSFVGASLLALSTSMPELSTSIAAVRVKAYTMAISNIFGSNLIMLFLLFPNDLAFTSGPIINEMDKPAAFALTAGIFMAAVYCGGMLIRPKVKYCKMGVDSLALVGIYLASLWVMFTLRHV
ncbi:hypothetical protein CA267_007810 [Alteromonas pelagimontana]|uniref:Sodium/calcium exchanger membrane region domain-containing protein n=1 Tax=Alteromonas pelagimontana TaxID=1858656 RepID=A0A6M4MBY0_9ALTE|nr:hypothetical protein [Alteromonas pelagimontana]QJR80691.1 hypothetical protein CA267_007810 [Alteromonas pelagimontana]